MDKTDFYIKKLSSFPKLPTDIYEKINFNLDQYRNKNTVGNNVNYVWSDDFNENINNWCQQNVVDGIYYAFQIATEDMPLHKDKNSTVKLIYVLDTGGDDVLTNFYNDKQELLHSLKVEPNFWYLLKTDVFHAVEGITRPRFSICATVFRILDLVKPIKSF